MLARNRVPGSPMKKTLYQILGVATDATKQEIAAAYERAQQNGQLDGDRNAALFLREAYQILSNDAQRAAYDASLARAAAPATLQMSRDDSVAEEASGRWLKWVAAIVVIAVAIAWWQSRKPAPRTATPPPVVTEVADGVSPQRSTAESAPAPATVRTQTRSAEEIFEQLAGSVARVHVLDGAGLTVGSGSGVVIGLETVITNCHVAARAAQLAVKIGAQTRSAVVSQADEELDLCRLHVAGLSAAAVDIGTVASLRTGQKVFTIGAPQGLELTISEGIVSALREVQSGTVIQTTAPISPGSSGGGLFNSAGQLVGITTFQHRYGQNLNFALPADWIHQMQSRTTTAQGRSFVPTQGVGRTDVAGMILGRWWCFGPVTGRNGEYTFSEDGSVSVVIGGKAGIGQYAVRGKALLLAGREPVTLAIDEMTAHQMVLHAGEGWRLVCERR
ncbi:MAG TPA: trypsin-like peptidase domain-containing protein [Burkholderiaceae bacterium]|nr:trypsin-like peptidase domain-containing protein [Burkholderiaceae bacterium]